VRSVLPAAGRQGRFWSLQELDHFGVDWTLESGGVCRGGGGYLVRNSVNATNGRRFKSSDVVVIEGIKSSCVKSFLVRWKYCLPLRLSH
jgi:hypothetical protein